jgi:predicted ATPase
MRIDNLHVANFRSIEEFSLEGLGEMVVIAGPNGCGKSSVLDAIRLLKSVYGGYQPNEWQQWMGEFNIRLDRDVADLIQLLRDKSVALQISARFVLAQREVEYLNEHAEQTAWRLIWQDMNPRRGAATPDWGESIAAEQRRLGEQAQERTQEYAARLRDALASPAFEVTASISPEGRLATEASLLAETVFRTYEPGSVGVIDFYSAQRQYAREQVGGVNLNLEEQRGARSQHLLYNPQAKYQNMKTELASSYVAGLIAREAGEDETPDTLEDTLKELFELFFEGKRFGGVTPTRDGRPTFPVELADGTTHDIDELSSGEKEILYGYLRLRNSRSRDSVILLDEPELHLNPRLVQGLPEFYHRHIGRTYGNQIWLVTHSDALLRESVGRPNFSVFHMRPAGGDLEGNQAGPLDTPTDVDRAIVDLIGGDLAAYRPGAPILVLEGSGEPAFDKVLVTRLFPDIASRVNIVAAGSKERVRSVVELLGKASDVGAVLGGPVHAIVDRNSGGPSADLPTWDVYHIENYLLHEPYIAQALEALVGRLPFDSEEQLSQALTAAARATIPEMVGHHLRTATNSELVGCINLGYDPAAQDQAAALFDALERSMQNLDDARDRIDLQSLQRAEEAYARSLEESLSDGGWRSLFRGRSILRRFAGDLQAGIGYEILRNLIVDKMLMDHFRPPGMERVLCSVLGED